ncbi:TonB-dependent receptor plug domain-containing protein [Ekhidna sp.]
MRKLKLIIALACMGWTVKAQDTLKTVQLDEVVVTGTKSEIPVEKSGKSIFKITRKDIENSSARSVADLLNEVPGVQMDGNFGPLGTNIDYFVRGASSKRTLVLIDGVPFNDPSGIDQTYDLRLLDVDQIESIEILKGGLSTLYGTGAAAGVINITLRKSSSKPISGNAKIEYGSFNTFKANAGVSGSADKLSYVINGGYKSSDGFSAARDESGSGNFDDDGFEGYNFLGKVGYQVTESFNLGLTGAYDYFESDFDGGAFADAQANFSEYKQLRFGASPTYKWLGGNAKGNFFVSKLERFFDSSGFISDNEAKNFQGDIVLDQNLSEKLKLVGGLNYQRLAYSQPDLEEESFDMIDPYVTLIYDVQDFNIQVGGRLNNHSDYGTNLVYNINPSYIYSLEEFDVKIFSSYSTSFITPSLFQLFGPFGANPDLDPEESRSAEGGFSIFNEAFDLSMVYFYRKDENLILFTGGSTSSYVNADQEIETDGLEISGTLDFEKNVTLSGHYTYTRRLNDQIAYRIPAHKYGISATYLPVNNLTTKLSYLHTGERDLQYFDNATFETVQVDAESFDLFDFLVSYKWNDLTLSGSLNNIFNEDYQAIAGFNSVGRNYTMGLKYTFN